MPFIRKGCCRHYSDAVLLGHRCRKGIPVLQRLGGAGGDIMRMIPCFAVNKPAFGCDAYEEPGVRELEIQLEAYQQAMRQAVALLRTLRSTDRMPGASGRLVCPECGDTLLWTRDAAGELSARCEREGCIVFPFDEETSPLAAAGEPVRPPRSRGKPYRLTK